MTNKANSYKPARPAVRVWAIYERPRDYPDKFVVRCWRASPGMLAPAGAQFAGDLAGARALIPEGLTRLPPQPGEDPVIVETWI